jgi:hypothetical protein
MMASKASLADVPKIKLAATKALQSGIRSVPTLTPKAAHTMIAYQKKKKKKKKILWRFDKE